MNERTLNSVTPRSPVLPRHVCWLSQGSQTYLRTTVMMRQFTSFLLDLGGTHANWWTDLEFKIAAINWSNVLILVRQNSGKHEILARKEESSPVPCTGDSRVRGSTVLDCGQNRNQLRGSAARRPVPFGDTFPSLGPCDFFGERNLS